MYHDCAMFLVMYHSFGHWSTSFAPCTTQSETTSYIVGQRGRFYTTTNLEPTSVQYIFGVLVMFIY